MAAWPYTRSQWTWAAGKTGHAFPAGSGPSLLPGDGFPEVPCVTVAHHDAG